MTSEYIWSTFPELKTERLVLREIIARDANDLFHIFSDEKTMEHWGCCPFACVNQARRLIQNVAQSTREEAGIHWAITLRNDNRIIGK